MSGKKIHKLKKMEKQFSCSDDFSIALGIANHVKSPCGACINGINHDLKDFYIRLAKKTITSLKDEYAKDFLEEIVKIYE